MPVKADNVFVAPSANVLGDVKIGAGSSIWYGAVLRGASETMHVVMKNACKWTACFKLMS